jgi:hypothetical protein
MDERLRFVARLLDGEAQSIASSLLRLSEVPLRERASGAGLKVSLEAIARRSSANSTTTSPLISNPRSKA